MKKQPTYGPEIKARAKKLREAGHSYHAIARLLGVKSHHTIRYWLNPEVVAKKTQYYQKTKERKTQYNAQYYEENRERIVQQKAQYNAQYRQENKESISQRKAQYYQENKERINQHNAQYYQENRERIAQYQAQYRQENPEKIRAKHAKRRASKRNATPPWFTKEHQKQINALYAEAIKLEEETGVQHHVDHIYPIMGKTRVNGKYQHTSCGLHVPWNLKVLPGPENLSKNCRMPDPATDPPTAW